MRRQAAQVLGPLRVGDKMVVLGLAGALKDADLQVRQNALNALQMLGPAGKLAATALKQSLVDADPQIRQTAYYTLQAMGVSAQAGLVKGLRKSKGRQDAHQHGQPHGHGGHADTTAAFPVLAAGLTEADPTLRIQAAHALAIARREPEKVAPVLAEGLKARDAALRLQAVQGALAGSW